MPGRPKHDYPALYAEFAHLRTQSDLTLTQFCADRDLNLSRTSGHFAELKRQAELNIFKGRNTEILLRAQSNVSRALDNEKLPDGFKATYGLEVYKAIADREGMSPAAQTISIKNSVAAIGQAVIAPLFNEDSDEFRKLAGAA